MDADNEGNAYDKAFTTWMADMEPDMEIIKVEYSDCVRSG